MIFRLPSRLAVPNPEHLPRVRIQDKRGVCLVVIAFHHPILFVTYCPLCFFYQLNIGLGWTLRSQGMNLPHTHDWPMFLPVGTMGFGY